VLALPSPPLETPHDFGQLPEFGEHTPSTQLEKKVMESRIRFLIAAAKVSLSEQVKLTIRFCHFKLDHISTRASLPSSSS
jgi:hypothetical protein